MTPLSADIIRTIEHHGPITSADIAERLTGLGYGGGACFDDFKKQVSKIASKLKESGKVIGDDIPQPKAKPMRVYRMMEIEEMASDVAEVEAVTEKCSATVQESLTVAETVTPEPVSVDVKIEQKMPITVHQAMVAVWNESLEPEDVLAFMRGIEFAEKHHGIGQ